MTASAQARIPGTATMNPYDFNLSLNLPFLGAYITDDIWGQGLGHVVVARRGPSGKVVFADFLVDVHCLGIKDFFLSCHKEARFDGFLDELGSRLGLKDIEPAFARKLLEEATAYAEGLGFPTKPEVRSAMRLLHEADPATCSEVFAFGKDGKPFYVSGPYDSAARRSEIVAALTKSCGEGHFDFLVHVGDAAPEFIKPQGRL